MRSPFVKRLLTALCLVGLTLPFLMPPHGAAQESAVGTPPAVVPRIGDIRIEIRDIFDDPDLGWLYRTANRLKVNTSPAVVRQELLFKEGDAFDEFLLRESERNLRTLGFLREVKITHHPRGDVVDIVVRAQDTWTFIPQLSYSSGTGQSTRSAGVAESNLLGLGKRVELLVREDESRRSIEGVFEDDRFQGTYNRLLTGYFDRDDGERGLFYFGRPFRSLVEKSSWSVDADLGDTIGRLFENGEERYIFRQKRVDLSARYVFAEGDPERAVSRYALGYDYTREDFSSADDTDFEDLGLEPGSLPTDPDLLAEDRLFTGPTASWQFIEPNFISMNYIDRFDRVEDYNLGQEHLVGVLLAPVFLGSDDDAILPTANTSRGWRFSRDSFLRTDLGASGRLQDGDLVNSLLRAEVKYYNVLGPLLVGDMFLGKHTLAASFFIDYGNDLDKDREFLIGGDNAVRGYEARTFTGDKRFAFNLENRMHFIDDVARLVSVGGVVFFDAGAATTASLGRMFADDVYSDIGVGLRFGFPRSNNGSVLRVDLALPLRDGPDGSEQFEPRIIVSGGQLFGARLRSENLGAEKSNVAVGFDR